MNSIRRTLTRSLLVTLVALMLAAGGVGVYATRAFLMAEFDSGLSLKARSLAALVEYEHERFEFELTEELMPEFDLASGSDYFQIWVADGETLVRSRSLRGGDLVRRTTPAGVEEIYDLDLPLGRSGRALAFTFQSRVGEEAEGTGVVHPSEPWTGPPVQLVLALDRHPLDAAVASFARGIVLMETVLIVAVLFLVRTGIRRGLSPLDELATEVDAIDEASLDRRLALEHQPMELLGVRRKLNELLERLQMAFDRERRFSSGAAHELRTPIAELRALTEVALKWPEGRSDAEQTRDMNEAHAIACQMEDVVGALLTIARNEHEVEGDGADVIALAPLVARAFERTAALAESKRIAISIQATDGLAVHSSRVPLLTLLRNLAENAVEYAPAGSPVSLSARIENQTALIDITNEDSTLTEADLPRLFEPFWRKDESRTDSRHSGLGLAVCDTLARAIRAVLTVRLEPPGHVTVTVALPRAVRRPEPSPSASVRAKAGRLG